MEAGIGPEVATPNGRYAAAKVRIAVDRLLALDDLWTAELELASDQEQLGEPDLEMLAALGEEMQGALLELAGPLADFREMVENAPPGVVNSAFAEIVKSPYFPRTLAEEILANPDDYELQGAVVEACDYLLTEVRPESDHLAEKLARIIEEGEVPPGDLRPAFRCALGLVVAGAGVAVSIADGGTVVTVVMNVAVDVGKGVVSWIKNDCPRRFPSIHFGRRE